MTEADMPERQAVEFMLTHVSLTPGVPPKK